MMNDWWVVTVLTETDASTRPLMNQMCYYSRRLLSDVRNPVENIFLQTWTVISSSTRNKCVSQIYFWFDIYNAFSPDRENSSPPAASPAAAHSPELSRTIEKLSYSKTTKEIKYKKLFSLISRVIVYNYSFVFFVFKKYFFRQLSRNTISKYLSFFFL